MKTAQNWTRSNIAATRDLSPTVREFEIRPLDGAPSSYPPGAHLQLQELAGVPAICDCRRGERGLCAMDVLAVQGEIDHRDFFFSPHEKAARQRICVCVSRAVGEITLDSALRPDG